MDRLQAFRSEIWGNARFGSGGSASEQQIFKRADTQTLGWHYLYTADEGWIDFGHFSNAADWMTSAWTGHLEEVVKYGGQKVEQTQHLTNLLPGLPTSSQTSSFTREDYRSNRLGAEFYTFLKERKGKYSDLAEPLRDFLQRYHPSEQPKLDAKDYGALPEDQNELDSTDYLTRLRKAWENVYQNGASGNETLHSRTRQAKNHWKSLSEDSQ